MADTFHPTRQITLPWAFVFALVCAAASWGGSYVSLHDQIQKAGAVNQAQDNTLVALSTRIGNMESDERVNAVTRAQLEKDAATTATSLNGFQNDVRNRLESVQSTLVELQVTLGAIKEASQAQLPGEPKKR